MRPTVLVTLRLSPRFQIMPASVAFQNKIFLITPRLRKVNTLTEYFQLLMQAALSKSQRVSDFACIYAVRLSV